MSSTLPKIKHIMTVAVIITTIAWLFAIFNLSAMNSESSNSKSTGLSEKLIVKVLDATNEAGITDSYPDEQKLAKAANLINKPIRKVAHATVYFVLALLLLAIGCIIFGSRKYLLTCLITLLLCFAFALADEYHQTFVDGRTGQLADILIDTTGACAGILLFSSYFIVWKIGKHESIKED